ETPCVGPLELLTISQHLLDRRRQRLHVRRPHGCVVPTGDLPDVEAARDDRRPAERRVERLVAGERLRGAEEGDGSRVERGAIGAEGAAVPAEGCEQAAERLLA